MYLYSVHHVAQDGLKGGPDEAKERAGVDNDDLRGDLEGGREGRGFRKTRGGEGGEREDGIRGVKSARGQE